MQSSPQKVAEGLEMNPDARLEVAESTFSQELESTGMDELFGRTVTELRRFRDLSGLRLACLDLESSRLRGEHSLLPLAFQQFMDLSNAANLPSVTTLSSGLMCFALPLQSEAGRRLVAVGYGLKHEDLRPEELVIAASEAEWTNWQLDEHLQQLPCISPNILMSLLRIVFSQVQEDRQSNEVSRRVDVLSNQLDQTLNEISLLHSLIRNLQISRAPLELAELSLERLREMVNARGCALFLETPEDPGKLFTSGSIPLAGSDAFRRLINRIEQHDWTRPLVRNGIGMTLLGADFPGLESLIMVPVSEGSHQSGWLACFNTTQSEEFTSVDSSLVRSVATILGTHFWNISLYHQQEELVVGVIQSMISTLDAKDPDTRGHSERVAMIARYLGEELQLPPEDLDDLYLAGVLHDIGKVGVDERILRKEGALEEEEFREIQKHPVIGYEILKGIKNLQRYLPGVRSHHERIDGAGYPDGLAGDSIPLMARILAVADAYDAMSRNRPYRSGMSVEEVERVFRAGAGSQWDANVIDAYFAIRHSIAEYCRTYRPMKVIDGI